MGIRHAPLQEDFSIDPHMELPEKPTAKTVKFDLHNWALKLRYSFRAWQHAPASWPTVQLTHRSSYLGILIAVQFAGAKFLFRGKPEWMNLKIFGACSCQSFLDKISCWAESKKNWNEGETKCVAGMCIWLIIVSFRTVLPDSGLHLLQCQAIPRNLKHFVLGLLPHLNHSQAATCI